MTKEVFDGFKRDNPERNALKWLFPLRNHNIKNVPLEVYHADLNWKF